MLDSLFQKLHALVVNLARIPLFKKQVKAIFNHFTKPNFVRNYSEVRDFGRIDFVLVGNSLIISAEMLLIDNSEILLNKSIRFNFDANFEWKAYLEKGCGPHFIVGMV